MVHDVGQDYVHDEDAASGSECGHMSERMMMAMKMYATVGYVRGRQRQQAGCNTYVPHLQGVYMK